MIYIEKDSKKQIGNVIIILFIGFVIGAMLTKQYINEHISEKMKLAEKHLKMFFVMKLWVTAYQKKKNIGKYLNDLGYYKIAIYGTGYIGEVLYQELKNSNVSVAYGIDQKKQSKLNNLKIYQPDEKLPKVDALIVTAITYFNDIEAALVQKMNCPIISIEDLLLEM